MENDKVEKDHENLFLPAEKTSIQTTSSDSSLLVHNHKYM